MKSDILRKAREYEKEHGEEIKQDHRPMFHVTPYVGWLNDPNGFSVYGGEYHLFYQYHPYSTSWGPMHWGHVKTKDLVKWERLPAALAPDQEYDEQGCFSGSAVELPDGRQLLLYTGVKGKDATSECRQTQCVAVGNGLDYDKYEGNPVLTAENLPNGYSPSDFRDPKIWWEEEDRHYYAVVANRTDDGSGSILLFSSEDAFRWEFVTVLEKCNNEYGKMWECPDFFSLGDTDVLIFSPQEMEAVGMEFHNGNDVVCITGDYDKQTHEFIRKKVQAVDYGLDFYAPQTLCTSDGRRILIGWMQSWETSTFKPKDAQWFGMMTLPRELQIKEGKLIQTPIMELKQYWENQVSYENVQVQGYKKLSDISGRTMDLTIHISPEEGAKLYDSFTIYIGENKDYRTAITYSPDSNTVLLDRTYSGFPYNVISKREAPVRNNAGEITMRIILDRYSAEIFINHGEQVMSTCLYTPQCADGISVDAKGTVRMDVDKHDIVVS